PPPQGGRASAVLFADDELEPRPSLVHGADLHVHETEWKREGADDVLAHVGLDLGGFLGPGDPDGAVALDARDEAWERGGEFTPALGEEVYDIEFVGSARDDLRSCGQGSDELPIAPGRARRPDAALRFDAELLREGSA